MDGSLQEIRRDEVEGLYPALGLLRHPLLLSEAVLCLHGKLVPVAGPLSDSTSNDAPVEERPWILSMGTHAQVVRGLPQFNDDISLARPTPITSAKASAEVTVDPLEGEEAALLQEMEELLRSA
jgi:hypothetical protein